MLLCRCDGVARDQPWSSVRAQLFGSPQSLVDTKKQSRPATKHGPHVMAFCVTNFGVVLVPYPPNSEESQLFLRGR